MCEIIWSKHSLPLSLGADAGGDGGALRGISDAVLPANGYANTRALTHIASVDHSMAEMSRDQYLDRRHGACDDQQPPYARDKPLPLAIVVVLLKTHRKTSQGGYVLAKWSIHVYMALGANLTGNAIIRNDIDHRLTCPHYRRSFWLPVPVLAVRVTRWEASPLRRHASARVFKIEIHIGFACPMRQMFDSGN